MGLCLSLLPFESQDSFFSHTVLPFDGDPELFEILLAYEKECGRRIPKNFKCYLCREGEGVRYGITQTTPYGDELLTVEASQLTSVLTALQDKVGFELSRYDQGVLSFLSHLNPDIPVALYWH